MNITLHADDGITIAIFGNDIVNNLIVAIATTRVLTQEKDPNPTIVRYRAEEVTSFPITFNGEEMSRIYLQKDWYFRVNTNFFDAFRKM